MASVTTEPNGNRIVQLACPDGKRRSIRLGKVSMKQANMVKTRVEELSSARLSRTPLDSQTAEWLGSIDDAIHTKLVKAGLAKERHKVASTAADTLAVFVDQFIAGRTDMAEGTIIDYRQAKGLLIEYFKADKSLADITAHDADQFSSWLKGTRKTKSQKPMAENTVRGHLKNSKLFFGAAVKARLIAENPFKGISSQLVKRPERMAFVDRETIQKVLDACHTTRWKAIVVLCRYAGLRCPSEVFALRWADVDFDRGRMKVRSPKGENHEKGIREMPLFPEVRRVLEELHIEPDGGEFVIATNDRSSATNLRTVFEKILRKAGVNPWPRLMQNLRSTWITELAREYPLQTVTAWLGNTPKVALENYLQVRDEDYAKAVQNPVQQPSESARSRSQRSETENENPLVLQGNPTKQGVFKTRKVPPTGVEPVT